MKVFREEFSPECLFPLSHADQPVKDIAVRADECGSFLTQPNCQRNITSCGDAFPGSSPYPRSAVRPFAPATRKRCLGPSDLDAWNAGGQGSERHKDEWTDDGILKDLKVCIMG